MRKLILAVLMCLPFALMAQQKIAVVNSQKVMSSYPEVAKVEAKLQELSKKYDADLKSMQDELKAKAEKYQKEKESLPATIQQRREQELQDIQIRIQQSYQAMQEDMQKQQEQLLAPVRTTISNAIKKVADSKGVAYVMEAGMMLHIGAEAMDITADVESSLGIKAGATTTKARK